jgi:hypothetical protein
MNEQLTTDLLNYEYLTWTRGFRKLRFGQHIINKDGSGTWDEIYNMENAIDTYNILFNKLNEK